MRLDHAGKNRVAENKAGQMRLPAHLARRGSENRATPPLGGDTITQRDLEVNKVPNPEPVLFPINDLAAKHTEALQAVFKPQEVPEGGPWCICSPGATLAAMKGAPVPCSELPWKCPFASAIASTPTS